MSEQMPPADNEDKLIGDVSMSGDNQILVLGLIAAAFILFGPTIWGWFF